MRIHAIERASRSAASRFEIGESTREFTGYDVLVYSIGERTFRHAGRMERGGVSCRGTTFR